MPWTGIGIWECPGFWCRAVGIARSITRQSQAFVALVFWELSATNLNRILTSPHPVYAWAI